MVNFRRRVLILCSVGLMVTGTVPVHAQSGQKIQADGRTAITQSPHVSAVLFELHAEYLRFSSRQAFADSPSFQAITNTLSLDQSGEMVAVRVTGDDVEGLLPFLENLGFEVLAAEPRLNFVEGYLPIVSIPQLDDLTLQGLLGVMPVYRPVTRAGSVISQADLVLEANRVRAALPAGFDGSGIQIGVLSDSFDNQGGAAADIASGDLPNNINVIEDFAGIDEGRAMLQLIHDLAPGAALSFATASPTPAVFATNIRALATAGADIIVDDIGYLGEPFFQDGVVSLAVDDVVTNNGAAYFSAAGNDGNIAYESTTFDTALDSIGPVVNGTFYDFDPGAGVDTRQRITIPNGATLILSLQWDDPFFTINGVDTDLDVVLVNPVNGSIVAAAADANIATQTPIELIGFQNTTGQTDFDIMIQFFSGPAPERIKYIPFSLSSDPADIYQEFATNSPTIFAHPAAAGAIAVAAVPYFNQTTPEAFSSIGPTTFLFSADGTPLVTAEVRQTPDLASIDGGETTFFGSPFNLDGPSPNFFGTSAAAPHAAAVAALVKQANPGFTPLQIYDRLRAVTTDLVTPGFDNITGAGLINAYDAVFGAVTADMPDIGEDFEDGDLPVTFETRSTGAGRIQVTTANGPLDSRHLTLDAAFDGLGAIDTDSLNEVILHVDTTGFSNIQLSFAQREFNDQDDQMPATFTGSVNADGVALSVDGSNWFRLFDLTGAASGNSYQNNSVDLSAFAAGNGLTLGAGVQIKFQQFGGLPIGDDGFAFDNIEVSGTPIPLNENIFSDQFES